MLRAMRNYGWQGWALLALRVAMGLFFLYEASNQLRGGWIGGDGLMRFLQARIDKGSVPGFYETFITDVVFEYDQLFTVAVILGEIGMGVTLILGLLTRIVCVNGIFMNVNFLIMNDKNLGAAGVDLLFVIGQAVLFAFAARQALSVDEQLLRRGLPLPLGPKREEFAAATT
jgi:thiosulfate dehydrogenase [quinone] large subunit